MNKNERGSQKRKIPCFEATTVIHKLLNFTFEK